MYAGSLGLRIPSHIKRMVLQIMCFCQIYLEEKYLEYLAVTKSDILFTYFI